jgi:hypothetical protein
MKNRICREIGALLLGLSGVLFSAQAVAEVDGSYSGEYQRQAVSAVLETLSSSVTGVLTIGESRYLLQADAVAGSLSGQLNNMLNGETLKLQIKSVGDTLDIRVQPASSAPMAFTLHRND